MTVIIRWKSNFIWLKYWSFTSSLITRMERYIVESLMVFIIKVFFYLSAPAIRLICNRPCWNSLRNSNLNVEESTFLANVFFSQTFWIGSLQLHALIPTSQHISLSSLVRVILYFPSIVFKILYLCFNVDVFIMFIFLSIRNLFWISFHLFPIIS